MHDKALNDGGAVMRDFNRENWEAANEQLGYFLKVLADEGYPDELIADVIMASVYCSSTKLRSRHACSPSFSALADGIRPQSRHVHRPEVFAMMGHSTRLGVL
jgi:hypothetical protein